MGARLLLGVLCAMFALAGADARGAEVSTIEEYCFRGSCPQEGTVTFDAAPGERNVVTITRDGDHLVIHDAGAPLVASRRCALLDERTARCERPGYSTHVTLGDRDDVLNAYASVHAEAGPGDDVLRAFPGDLYGGGVLVGDDGDDLLDASQAGDDGFGLVGGAGDDQLTGGPAGYERLEPGPGADLVDGGGGDGDLFLHGDRSDPLELSLAQRRSSEDPLVTGFEIVAGGRGDDRISGSERPETIRGGRGDDVLDGAGGDDVVEGDVGADRVAGGDGDDRLFGWIAPPDSVVVKDDDADRLSGGSGDDVLDGGLRADRIACGEGRDTVAAAHADGDRLPGAEPGRATDCERLNFRATRPGSFCMALDDVVRRRSQLLVGDACAGQPRLRSPRTVELLDAAGVRLAEGMASGRGPLRLPLSAPAHRLLRPGAVHETQVSVRRIGPRGRPLAPATVQVALGVSRPR